MININPMSTEWNYTQQSANKRIEKEYDDEAFKKSYQLWSCFIENLKSIIGLNLSWGKFIIHHIKKKKFSKGHCPLQYLWVDRFVRSF